MESCAKFVLSEPVSAKMLPEEKEGLGPPKLSNIFYFVIGVFLDSRASSDKN
jgi:hypothetical protein